MVFDSMRPVKFCRSTVANLQPIHLGARGRQVLTLGRFGKCPSWSKRGNSKGLGGWLTRLKDQSMASSQKDHRRRAYMFVGVSSDKI